MLTAKLQHTERRQEHVHTTDPPHDARPVGHKRASQKAGSKLSQLLQDQ